MPFSMEWPRSPGSGETRDSAASSGGTWERAHDKVCSLSKYVYTRRHGCFGPARSDLSWVSTVSAGGRGCPGGIDRSCGGEESNFNLFDDLSASLRTSPLRDDRSGDRPVPGRDSRDDRPRDPYISRPVVPVLMESTYRNPVPPYPGWERRVYRLPRPVTAEDVRAILNGQEEYIRTIGADRIVVVHKFGLLEIDLVVGSPEVEVWFSPEQRARTAEYLDALFATRF